MTANHEVKVAEVSGRDKSGNHKSGFVVGWWLVAATVGACGVGPADSAWDAGVDTRQADTQAPAMDRSGPTLTGITVDGEFGDWPADPMLVDRLGDGHEGGLDLVSLDIASDASQVTFRLRLSERRQLNAGHSLTLYIDADDDPATGWLPGKLGAELVWVMGQRQGYLNLGGGGQAIGHSDIGFASLPSVASTVHELVIARDVRGEGGAPLFSAPRIRVRLWDEGRPNGDQLPDGGAALSVALSDAAPPQGPAGVARRPDTLRIVSFNVLFDSILEPHLQDAYARVFQALDPDVIMLQEALLSADGALDRVNSWLPLAEGAWSSRSLSDRVTLSRFPFREGWPSSFDPLHHRLMVASIVAGGAYDPTRELVTFNAHLSCCDDDAGRQAQADSFIAYIRRLRDPRSPVQLFPRTAFVVAGDFNTVGDPGPLNTLLTGDIVNEGIYGPDTGPDWDRTPLTDPMAVHAGGARATTWRSPSSSYWPGRIDFTLVSDSVARIVGAFVLDTAALPPDTRDALGLEAEDSAMMSDHLPVVVDLEWPGLTLRSAPSDAPR